MGTFTGRPPGAGLTTLARSPNSPPRANLPLCTAFALKRVARMAALPYATLVQGADGNFYGTTGSGGTHDNCLGEGWMVSVQLPCAGEQENTSLKPSFSTPTRHIVSYDASAPQNLCWWASEPCNFWAHNISHLAGLICEGNWASRRGPAGKGQALCLH